MVLGVGTGLLGGETAASWVGWLGTLFMRLLRMVIIPLVVVSIVSGIATVGGGRALGRLFGKTLGYYVLSSALAIFAGLVLVNLIRPGEGADLGAAEGRALPEAGDPRLRGRAASRHRPAELPRRRGRGGHAGGDLLLDPCWE